MEPLPAAKMDPPPEKTSWATSDETKNIETPIPPKLAKAGTLVGNVIMPYEMASRMFMRVLRA